MSKTKSPFWKRSPKETPAPAPRPIAEIQAEFNKCAADAGQLQFEIVGMQSLLQRVNLRMAQLQDEHTAARKLESEKLPTPTAPEANAPSSETNN